MINEKNQDNVIYYGIVNDNKSSWRHDRSAGWEQDFLFNEFFTETKFQTILFSPNEINNLLISKNTVLIFSSNAYRFEDLKNLVLKSNPKIIIHFSDEWGNKPQYDELSEYCELYIRQYRNRYQANHKVKVLPLGYNLGMFDESCLLYNSPISTHRFLNWSFVGNMKSDRWEMLDEFRRIPKGSVGNADGLGMRTIYSQSKFVPVGRGHVSLNCFRIYEAVSCGAIPVVVGPKEEILNTFQDEGDYPWITAEKWKKAVEICRDLLASGDEINKIQTKNLDWWKGRINQVRGLICQCIDDSCIPPSQ